MTVGSDEMVQYIRRTDSGYKLAICMRLLGFAAFHGFVVIRVAILYGSDILRGLEGLLAIASGWQFEVSVWVQSTQALLIGLPQLLELLFGVWIFDKWCELSVLGSCWAPLMWFLMWESPPSVAVISLGWKELPASDWHRCGVRKGVRSCLDGTYWAMPVAVSASS